MRLGGIAGAAFGEKVWSVRRARSAGGREIWGVLQSASMEVGSLEEKEERMRSYLTRNKGPAIGIQAVEKSALCLRTRCSRVGLISTDQ